MHKSQKTSREQRRIPSVAKKPLRCFSRRRPRDRDHRRDGTEDQGEVEDPEAGSAAAEDVHDHPVNKIGARHLRINDLPVRRHAMRHQQHQVVHRHSIAHERPAP
jgi:hypothetical protein